MFYRPQAQGYTNEIACAGTFVESFAKEHAKLEGVTIHPINACWEEINGELANHEARVSHLRLFRMLIEEMGSRRPNNGLLSVPPASS